MNDTCSAPTTHAMSEHRSIAYYTHHCHARFCMCPADVPTFPVFEGCEVPCEWRTVREWRFQGGVAVCLRSACSPWPTVDRGVFAGVDGLRDVRADWSDIGR